MRELVMDFVDMIKPVGGKRYMLVVVDRFSRWPEACPTKRKDAQSVAKVFMQGSFYAERS